MPQSWPALAAALRHLHDAYPSALPDAAVAATLNADAWDLATACRVHRLLRTQFRDQLEQVGIDVDMLPIPPAPVTIDIAADPNFVTLNPPPDQPLPNQVATLLKGVWGVRVLPDAYHVPVTTTAVDALRTLVTRLPVDVTDLARDRLRNPTPPPVAGVTLSEKGRVRVEAEPHQPLVHDLTRVQGLRWVAKDACWWAPASQVEVVVKIADKHHLPVSEEARDAAGASTAPFDFDGSLQALQGVPLTDLTRIDDAAAGRYADMGITSIYDLLMRIPRRYLDRSQVANVTSAALGEEIAVLAKVTRLQVDTARRLVRFEVTDTHGTPLTVTFFNALWQAKRFRTGDEVVLLGVLDEWVKGSRRSWQMTNPVMDLVGDDTLPVIPVYGQSAKSRISTWDITQATREALSRISGIADPIPAHIIDAENLIPRDQALRLVHFPDSVDQVGPARTRLAFDELFRMQAALQMSKHGHATRQGFSHYTDTPALGQFLTALPFDLTPAQQRAWESISADLRFPTPMHRLLQGDVGSGKTMIAALTLLSAVTSGRQAALMAPTEILATQLFTELTARLDGITMGGRPIRIELFTNKVRGKRREALLADLANGDIDIAVGTHALLVEDITFSRLSAVVVDEQHRFGVEQRALLRDKTTDGVTPDMLVMTATPIPRTAAMTVFGDLDMTVLDELPPGRTPIDTQWFDTHPALDGLATPPWDSVRDAVAQGRQAYVVCPLVTESEKLQAANAVETFHALSEGALAGLRVGLVHGQQKSDERAAAMSAFVAGDLDVLVATTVIEVGVNVPNATVMVILDCGRFGIAQLHQLRGRVGRGSHASQCFLIGRVTSADGRARMKALVDSTDGFYLSEVDLSLRGHGSILGSEQSGMSDLRVADLDADLALLEKARVHVNTLSATDPTLARRPLLRAEVVAALGSQAMSWLSRS